MKIALVYDRVNKFGGAEQVLLAMHALWPEAPLFTAVYNPDTAAWAKVFRVIPSFLDAIPFARTHHELIPWITPMAFESFSFDDYDVVISITSAEAKGIITKPTTRHICYCLTPTRYLWSGYDTYTKRAGMGMFSVPATFALKKMGNTLKEWDRIASARPDSYVAISQHVQQRIETYYHRPVATVIYPPVNTSIFTLSDHKTPKEQSFVTVARLVGYKRVDLLVDAFNQLQLPLTIIGDGRDRAFLQKRAGHTIRFITEKLTDTALSRYYQESSAFIFAGQEDFGIVAAEALACGTPVLCYANSGMAEIVTPGKTGATFPEQTVSSIIDAVQQFRPEQYTKEHCRQQAMKFDTIIFQKQWKEFINL